MKLSDGESKRARESERVMKKRSDGAQSEDDRAMKLSEGSHGVMEIKYSNDVVIE